MTGSGEFGLFLEGVGGRESGNAFMWRRVQQKRERGRLTCRSVKYSNASSSGQRAVLLSCVAEPSCGHFVKYRGVVMAALCDTLHRQ